MMTKAKSRAAMIDYILSERRPYATHLGQYDRYLFNWNVKAHAVNYEHPKGEYEFDPALDEAWEKYLAENPDAVQWAFEDASRYLADNEWTPYPGVDQGNWHFEFAGRGGGHLCLVQWHNVKFRDMGAEEIRDLLGELSFADLKGFYRGIVTADSDFTSAKASENVEYYMNDIRGQWEEEQHAEKEAQNIALAESYADARPDLYNGLLP